MEFMEWAIYLCVPPGSIKETVCIKMLDRKFLFLTVSSHLQVAVFQGSQIYLGDLIMYDNRKFAEIVHTFSYSFFSRL